MSTTNSTFPETLWAGTEHSLMIAVEAHNKIMAGILNSRPDDDEEEEDDRPYSFSQQGDVGIDVSNVYIETDW